MDIEQEILRLLKEHKDGISLYDFENIYFKRVTSVKGRITIKLGDAIVPYLDKLVYEGKITFRDGIAKLI